MVIFPCLHGPKIALLATRRAPRTSLTDRAMLQLSNVCRIGEIVDNLSLVGSAPCEVQFWEMHTAVGGTFSCNAAHL